MNRNHYTAIGILLFIILVWTPSRSQSPSFDLSFRVDTESAEELLRYLEGTSFNPARITQSRGTQLAATTSLLLARTTESVELQRALEMIRNGVTPNEDLFGLTDVRQALPFVRKLLDETKKRQLDRRIRGTLSSYFPADLELHASVPVYVVAFGNEKAAAFVRRVVWNGNTPVFVGESDGEPVIVLNLARCMFSDKLEVQFTEMLAILAHECFHAAFSLAQQQHPNTPIPHNAMEALAELAQNEGIAYLLSMQIHHGGTAPTREWLSATSRAVQELLKTMSLLSDPSTSPTQARELMLNANLSGSFEGNYGATAGLRIAYEIDSQLGRAALTETITKGFPDFFRKYGIIARRAGLPPLSDQLKQHVAPDEE